MQAVDSDLILHLFIAYFVEWTFMHNTRRQNNKANIESFKFICNVRFVVFQGCQFCKVNF